MTAQEPDSFSSKRIYPPHRAKGLASGGDERHASRWIPSTPHPAEQTTGDPLQEPHHPPVDPLSAWERRLDRLIDWLPWRFRSPVRWLLQPSSIWIRVPAGLLLVCGGFLGFLPVLGFWMIPLGLVLLAEDMPPLRSARALVLDWIERCHPRWLAAAPALLPCSNLRKESR
jgi:hypothetical protein